AGRNWSTPPLQGTALFVEAAVSWLASRDVVLDIPPKAARPAGLSLTEDALRTVLLEVVVALPLAVLIAGVVVRWRRQKTEEKSRKAAPKAPDRPKKAQSKKARPKPAEEPGEP